MEAPPRLITKPESVVENQNELILQSQIDEARDLHKYLNRECRPDNPAKENREKLKQVLRLMDREDEALEVTKIMMEANNTKLYDDMTLDQVNDKIK